MAFLDPLALLFSGLIGVLVLFYLWERWRRRVTVPSLLLWQAVREDTIRARRFRPDLLFFLQLLLLLALILGLAKPYFPGQDPVSVQERRIIVLDTSASMQAREGRTSRFQQATSEALGVLADLRPTDEVMLILAGAAPEVAVNFTRDHAVVAHAIEAAMPTDTGGSLDVALAFADAARRRSDLPAEVDVFTDIPRTQLPENLRDLVTVFQVGESDDNIGIQALQVFQGRFQDPRRARAQVLVQNYAHQERHGFLTVQLDDQILSRTGFTLPARETRGFLVNEFPGPGVVMARLEVTDALAADNTAWGWIRPTVPVHVLVVSADTPFVADLRALAAATPSLEVSVATPASVTAASLAGIDIAIFHRVFPQIEPPVNALYVYPDAGNVLFPVVGEVKDVEVIDWNATHPALAALRPLAALPLQRARIINPPAWSQVLLWSRNEDQEFPLALAGEHNGRRIACLAFDLEAERLLSADNVNFFLFFMNLLGWLTPDALDTMVVNTGDVRRLGPFPQEPVRMRDPHGRETALTGAAPHFEPLVAGVYRFASDGTRQTLLANFMDPIESDIGRASKEPPVTRRATVPVQQPATQTPHREYSLWLYAVAATLLLLEWAAARRTAT